MFVEIEPDNADAAQILGDSSKLIEINIKLFSEDVRSVHEETDRGWRLRFRLETETGTNLIKHAEKLPGPRDRCDGTAVTVPLEPRPARQIQYSKSPE